MQIKPEFHNLKLVQLLELITSSLLFDEPERSHLHTTFAQLTDQSKIDIAFNHFFQGEESFLKDELEQLDVADSTKQNYRERLAVLITIRAKLNARS